MIYPENFIERIKFFTPLIDNILVTLFVNLLQIAIALMLIFRLHLKVSIYCAIILTSLISFIYYYNSVEIIPVIELFPKIIILNHGDVIDSLLNIQFLIIALILSRIKKSS